MRQAFGRPSTDSAQTSRKSKRSTSSVPSHWASSRRRATWTSDSFSRTLVAKLKKMVGFRNVAVHEYQTLNLQVVEAVITKGLDDLLAFTERIIEWDQASGEPRE